MLDQINFLLVSHKWHTTKTQVNVTANVIRIQNLERKKTNRGIPFKLQVPLPVCNMFFCAGILPHHLLGLWNRLQGTGQARSRKTLLPVRHTKTHAVLLITFSVYIADQLRGSL